MFALDDRRVTQTSDTLSDAGVVTTAVASGVVAVDTGFAGCSRRASACTRRSITFRSSAPWGNRQAMRQSEVADNPVQVRGRIGDTELPFDKDAQLLAVPHISFKPV